MMNKIVTKTQLLAAISQLKRQYKANKHIASIEDCSLCKIYNRTYLTDIACSNCINIVFDEGNLPCINRMSKTPNFKKFDDLLTKESQQFQYQFWAKVHNALKDIPAKAFITDTEYIHAIVKTIGEEHYNCKF